MMSEMEASSGASASGIVSQLKSYAEALARNESGAREKMLLLSQRLTATLETPSEAIQKMGWAEPARFAATRTAIELKIFDILDGASGNAMHVSQIAKSASVEPGLISRILKHLAAMNILSESGADEYANTKFSQSLTVPKYRDGISYCFDVAGPSFQGLPEYLKKTNYENPHDIANGPFQYAHKTEHPFFVWLGERPEHFERFNNYMSGYRQGKHSWMDAKFYPLEDRLIEGASNDSVFLVDIGGGMGHDLEELKSKCMDKIASPLVLQEQANVIAQIPDTTSGIKLQVHDFFTRQPVIGARAYYLHSVLHDWDDASCIKILRNIVPSMRSGYSKLLINEYVIPSANAEWSGTSMDWLMMALGAVKERTEAEWRSLLGEAGLRVIRVWTYDQGTESLIEAEV